MAVPVLRRQQFRVCLGGLDDHAALHAMPGVWGMLCDADEVMLPQLFKELLSGVGTMAGKHGLWQGRAPCAVPGLHARSCHCPPSPW